MSSNDQTKTERASKIVATVLAILALIAVAILALIAVAILILKQDDCFGDPEPEPVPCSGEHCPASSEMTTGAVIKNPESDTGKSTESDAVPLK